MILVNTYTEMEKYLAGKDTAEFSFIGKDKITYNVLVTKVYESTIKKYPEVSSTGYKFTITFNGNRVDSKVYRLKTDITQCLKIALGELGFKEKIDSNLGWDVSVSFDSQDIPVNFDTNFDEINTPRENNILSSRIEQIKRTNTHKTFNPDSIYARIVLEDLGYSWDTISFKDRGSKGYLIKFNLRMRELAPEDLERAKVLESQILQNQYPFNVKLNTKRDKFVLEVEYYKE